MRYQELLFTASVLGAAIALHNCRHPGNMRFGPSIFQPGTLPQATRTAGVPDEESPSQTRPQRTQSVQMSSGLPPESRRRPMQEACLKRANSGSRTATFCHSHSCVAQRLGTSGLAIRLPRLRLSFRETGLKHCTPTIQSPRRRDRLTLLAFEGQALWRS